MSRPSRNRITPPAMRKAGSEMPKNCQQAEAGEVEEGQEAERRTGDVEAISARSRPSRRPTVAAANSGTLPIGSIRANSATKKLTAKSRSASCPRVLAQIAASRRHLRPARPCPEPRHGRRRAREAAHEGRPAPDRRPGPARAAPRRAALVDGAGRRGQLLQDRPASSSPRDGMALARDLKAARQAGVPRLEAARHRRHRGAGGRGPRRDRAATCSPSMPSRR